MLFLYFILLAMSKPRLSHNSVNLRR